MTDPRVQALEDELRSARAELRELRRETAALLAVKVRITDRGIFDRVLVEQFHAWARAHGWVRHGKARSGNYWQHSVKRYDKERAPVEVAIPRKNGFGDHATVLALALETFSEVEGRTQLEILSEIMRVEVRTPKFLGAEESVEGPFPEDG